METSMIYLSRQPGELPSLSPNLGADLSGKAVLPAALKSILYWISCFYYKRNAMEKQLL